MIFQATKLQLGIAHQADHHLKLGRQDPFPFQPYHNIHAASSRALQVSRIAVVIELFLRRLTPTKQRKTTYSELGKYSSIEIMDCP